MRDRAGRRVPSSGANDYTESVTEFLSGPPRICAPWDDLIATPSGGFPGGDVYFNGSQPGRAIVTWDTRELATSNPVTVQLVLLADGSFTIAYRNAGRDGIVGVTPGNGAPDPGEIDVSQGIQLNLGTTVYEEFASATSDPSDLQSMQLWFRPNAASGYDLAALPANCFDTEAMSKTVSGVIGMPCSRSA